MNAILDIALSALEERKENRALTLRRGVAYMVERFAGEGVMEEELSEAVHVHKRKILDAFRDNDTLEIGRILERVIFNLADRINESLEEDRDHGVSWDEAAADEAGKPCRGPL